jgi:diadenosine tetraphosphate (Ap4A) HIT family hydrolase
MNDTCPFCDHLQARATLLASYDHWYLFLQSDEKRAETKQAAGFLAAKQHVTEPTDLCSDEWLELKDIIKDAGRRLCRAAGVTYTNQETVGFNQGSEAGQTVAHAHVHILPVAQEDPGELKVRGGIGGAFEALRKERLAD